MNLFRNVVFIAAIAGLVAGIALACMQAYATVPLILKAEVYEKAGGGHHHDHAASTNNNAMSSAAPADNAMSSAAPAPAEAAAPAEDEGWAPADGFERFAFNVVANIVTGVGFGLI
ncbi:MAG: cobalt transporter, partial [Mesorhizobium sp.]